MRKYDLTGYEKGCWMANLIVNGKYIGCCKWPSMEYGGREQAKNAREADIKLWLSAAVFPKSFKSSG